MFQERWRSPVVWAAVAAQVLAVLVLVGTIGDGMGNVLNQIVAGVLELLVMFGVLNNPTDKENF